MSKIDPRSLLQKIFLNCHVDALPLHKAVSVDQSVSCYDAVTTMNAEKIGCLLIKSSANPFIGILTENDIVKKLWADRRSPQNVCVGEIMTEDPIVLRYHASVAKALYMMRTQAIRHIPVYSKDNSLSIFSATDIIRFLHKKMMHREESLSDRVKFVDDQSGLDAFFDGELSLLPANKTMIFEPTTSISDVVESMRSSRMNGVVLGNPVKMSVRGIFTERDILKKVILKRSECQQMPVESVMTCNPITLQSTTSIAYAFQAMAEGRYRHIPIVDFDEKLVGMLSIEKFVEFISTEILSELERGQS